MSNRPPEEWPGGGVGWGGGAIIVQDLTEEALDDVKADGWGHFSTDAIGSFSFCYVCLPLLL